MVVALGLPALTACSGLTEQTSGPTAVDGQTSGTAVASPSQGGTSAPADGSASTTAAPPVIELPRGGTEIFPTYRLFGYSGAPGSEGLGRLGIGDLDDRVVEMEERAAEFVGRREVLPVLELIATVVHPVPGPDGMYRSHLPDEIVQDHLDAARRHDGILLLNIQPGRADFLDEVEYWRPWLEEPDVGVALDPEWAVEEGQVPGTVYGRTTGQELDDVAAYLSEIVAENDLPEKVMVYHQVHTSVVRDLEDLREHDGVVIINSVDGIGAPADKVLTYDRVMQDRPSFVHAGFKLFYVEDAAVGPLMTGAEVLDLRPRPEYILFE